MTIYIGIQPNKLAESRLIVNLFFSQLINQNTKELPQNNPALKHQCLLLMDEFTSIGKVEIIATAVRDGGFPPLMLDPVDFVGLYRQSLERQATAQAAQVKPV